MKTRRVLHVYSLLAPVPLWRSSWRVAEVILAASNCAYAQVLVISSKGASPCKDSWRGWPTVVNAVADPVAGWGTKTHEIHAAPSPPASDADDGYCGSSCILMGVCGAV